MTPANQLIKYKEYEIEDFLGDEFFIDWVKNPNDDNSHFWDVWLEKHPEKRTMIASAAGLIRSISYASYPGLSDQEYLDMFEEIIKEPIKNQEYNSESWLSKFLERIPFAKIAACFLFCFVTWVTIEVYWVGVEVDEAPVLEVEWVEKSTPLGLKSTFFLSDGTKITLNSESKLRFPKTFDTMNRIVEIEGEAFFEVKKEIRPFKILTAIADIEVLGTSFNVKEGEEGKVTIALVTGKVKVVDQKGNQIFLDPNEMLTFSSSGDFLKQEFDERYITAWKDRILVFKESNPKEVAERISRWFGIKLTLIGEFPSDWKYTGEYKEELLENVLLGIEKTSSARFQFQESEIKFSYQSPKNHE